MKTFLLSAIFASFCASSAFGDRIKVVGLLYKPRAVYPVEAIRNHVEGSGTIAGRIDGNGAVVKVWIGQSTGSALLDEAAVKWVRQWRFLPGQGGTVFRTPFTFSLRGPPQL